MYTFSHATHASHATQEFMIATQEYTITTQEYAVNPALMPLPSLVPAGTQAGLVPFPISTSTGHVSMPVLAPVQVPPGCYPLELTQFSRSDGQPQPLHWALFVRTAPSSVTLTTSRARPRLPPIPAAAPTVPAPAPALRVPQQQHGGTGPSSRGNFYELVGTPETYTAQFLVGVGFSPEMLPDWRGSHVIGWVHPGSMAAFEHGVGQVQVRRQRADWQSQQWTYEVLMKMGEMRGNTPGVFVEGVTWAGLHMHMEGLLNAWEKGEI